MTAFYFENPKDEVAGALIWYGPPSPRPDDAPQLRIQTKDGRVREVTAHQERLKAELCRLEPAIGDRIRIVYDGEAEKAAPGMNKAKLFTVEVRRPNPQTPGRSEPTRGSATENGPGSGEPPA